MCVQTRETGRRRPRPPRPPRVSRLDGRGGGVVKTPAHPTQPTVDLARAWGGASAAPAGVPGRCSPQPHLPLPSSLPPHARIPLGRRRRRRPPHHPSVTRQPRLCKAPMAGRHEAQVTAVPGPHSFREVRRDRAGGRALGAGECKHWFRHLAVVGSAHAALRSRPASGSLSPTTPRSSTVSDPWGGQLDGGV